MRTEHTKFEIKKLSINDQKKIIEQIMNCYNNHTAAEKYILGFKHKNKWYAFETDHIKTDWCVFRWSSSSTGLHTKLNLRILQDQKQKIIDSGICIEIDPNFIDSVPGNKGFAFEKYITENIAKIPWHRSQTPFYESGDCIIKGKQYQIKLNGGQIVVEQTLTKRNWLVID